VLIPALDDYYDPGYLPRPAQPALAPFFPNCNLAVRRGALEQAGGYDARMTAGEDADVCRRVAEAGWDMVYRPEAVVLHEPRPTLRALAAQWWNYGFAGASHFQSGRRARLEIYWNLEPWPRIHRFRPLLAVNRAPLAGIVFLTYFPLLLGLALAAAAAALAGSRTAAALLGAGCAAGFGWVVVRRTPGARVRARLAHGALVLVLDVACTAGCLAATFRRGKLFLYPGI